MKGYLILSAKLTLVLALFISNAFAADPAVTVTILPPSSVTEGGGNLIFVLRRAPVSATQLRVRFKMTGSAPEGQDYAAPVHDVNFAQNAETINVTIQSNDDSTAEPNETVTLNVLPPV